MDYDALLFHLRANSLLVLLMLLGICGTFYSNWALKISLYCIIVVRVGYIRQVCVLLPFRYFSSWEVSLDQKLTITLNTLTKLQEILIQCNLKNKITQISRWSVEHCPLLVTYSSCNHEEWEKIIKQNIDNGKTVMW